MKRLIMLAVLCAFVLSAATASAADLKASGYFKSAANWLSNTDFVDGNSDNSDTETFDLRERIEFSLNFIANENLKAVVTVRHGSNTWGDEETKLTGTGDLAVRKAYVDFNWGATNVKIGHQGVALPYAYGGSMLLDGRSSAILVSTPLAEGAALTAGFIRVADADGITNDELDLYALIGDFNVGEANLKPFFVTSVAGEDNRTFTDGELDGTLWLGLSATMGFGDINATADINYGAISGEDEADDKAGFAVLLSAEFAAMDTMTPEAFFIYTTGEDDDNTNGSERMAQVGEDWAIGSFFFGGDAWLDGNIQGGTAKLGFAAIGGNLKNIASFADGLTHQATLIYAMGTNDEQAAKDGDLEYGEDLTTEDYMIELDFNSYYKLYDELTLGVELGYVMLSADEDTWGADGGSAYKLSTGLKYSF